MRSILMLAGLSALLLSIHSAVDEEGLFRSTSACSQEAVCDSAQPEAPMPDNPMPKTIHILAPEFYCTNASVVTVRVLALPEAFEAGVFVKIKSMVESTPATPGPSAASVPFVEKDISGSISSGVVPDAAYDGNHGGLYDFGTVDLDVALHDPSVSMKDRKIWAIAYREGFNPAGEKVFTSGHEPAQLTQIKVDLDGREPGGADVVPDEEEESPGVLLASGSSKLVVQSILAAAGTAGGTLTLTWPDLFEGNKKLKVTRDDDGTFATDGTLSIDCAATALPLTLSLATLKQQTGGTWAEAEWDPDDQITVTMQHSGVAQCIDQVKLTILKVDLTAIKFNHKGTVTADDPGPDNETSDGLIIRKNYSTEVGHKDHTNTGEWKPSLSRNDPFLYVVDKTVTIKARFTIAPSIDTTLTIAANSVGGTFPNVTPKAVSFVNGVSVGDPNGYVEFDIAGKSHQFDGDSDKDVARSVDSWKWEITAGIVIGDIGVSGPHTNYCVVNVPKTPWYRSAVTQPWISALDLACDWAGDAPDSRVAASFITQHLYNSGLVGYYSGSQWLDGSGTFRLTDLIVQWTIPSIVAMDCHDLADTVYIFGNLVGCQNSAVDLERWAGNITLKKHKKIGQPNWTVDGELVSEHSICKGSDGVCDATYKFDDGSLFGKFALGESLSSYVLMLTTDTVRESGSRQVPIK